ncbi:hypothetical protein SCHPADRAFT_947881 [Schizopora paradoxa]|uniref:MYND-type domain-containing protein n=1 Tax=Schizopora paradoxa TaxID=27342 RepID=A0A0H2QXV8_9AGAM|nr:hypothetical protein SCHPADRAFT_947881 [Schizopora paradoxa]
MHPSRFVIEGHGLEGRVKDCSCAAKEAVSRESLKILQMAKRGSTYYRNRLIEGIEGLPHEYKADATLFILKALKREGGNLPAHSVSSLVENVRPLFAALHKMKSLGRDMPPLNERQLFDIWPTCFKWCQQIAGAILDNRSDCPPTKSMLYFILLVIHMFAAWKGLTENPTNSKEFRRLAISLWLHSYDSTEAQHDATELMVYNFQSHSTGIHTTNSGIAIDDYRRSLVEVTKKMHLSEETVMNMALKRLVRASAAQSAMRFHSETFHSDYHLTALSMLINGSGSTVAIASRFSTAFEKAHGPLIVTNALGSAVKAKHDGIYRDHFLVSGLTTLACAFRSSTSMAMMREILRPELFDTIIKASLRLSANSPPSDPLDSERWRLRRSLIKDILYHRIAPLLLFRSTMNAMKDYLLQIFKSSSLESLLEAGVGWDRLLRVYNLDIKPHEYLEGQRSPDVHRCANVHCDVVATTPGTETAKNRVFSCGGCQFTTYCSKECQLVGWNSLGHRQDCPKTKKLLEKTGLSASDAKALSLKAYHHVTGQMVLLNPHESLGILVDFTSEMEEGILKMESFFKNPPDEEFLPIFPAVCSRGTISKKVLTLTIQVKYILFEKETTFAFTAPFDEGVIDGTKCSCAPYREKFPSICMKHAIHPKVFTVRREAQA